MTHRRDGGQLSRNSLRLRVAVHQHEVQPRVPAAQHPVDHGAERRSSSPAQRLNGRTLWQTAPIRARRTRGEQPGARGGERDLGVVADHPTAS